MIGTPDNTSSPGATQTGPVQSEAEYTAALDAHRAGLKALRGAAYVGAPYSSPEPFTDERTPAVRQFDAKFGAPDNGKYDLAGIEGAGDVAATLHDLNVPAVAGRSLVESFTTAQQEYQSLTPEGRAAWSARQAEMLSRVSNSEQLLADAKNMMALINQSSPALAKRILCGDTVPFMTAVLLAHQFQRLAHRTRLSRGAS